MGLRFWSHLLPPMFAPFPGGEANSDQHIQLGTQENCCRKVRGRLTRVRAPAWGIFTPRSRMRLFTLFQYQHRVFSLKTITSPSLRKKTFCDFWSRNGSSPFSSSSEAAAHFRSILALEHKPSPSRAPWRGRQPRSCWCWQTPLLDWGNCAAGLSPMALPHPLGSRVMTSTLEGTSGGL